MDGYDFFLHGLTGRPRNVGLYRIRAGVGGVLTTTSAVGMGFGFWYVFNGVPCFSAS